ncbi:hypothetical protein [Magnetospirillum sulfuroxidans]|uniref:Uncharacterized protein n=1 Tax=Magnetospirillum sulfuroxidans TaxID=611300 RepID=A0ABS5IAN1_9PROT|nr:hypothetical protein [Magnetospirillum sulfuroxidans]MBR9970808.1 hypothetical protein [Magnetospirillum sulfuroxidans]
MSLRPSIQKTARAATADLSRIGAVGGPSAALGAFLSDMAGGMIADANQAEADKVSTEAYAQGAAQGSKAAMDGAAPILPQDESTVRNKALKQGALAGWMARFDVDSQTKAETWAAEHADNPDAFKAKWDGMSSGTVAMVPPELQPQVRAELDRRGGLTLARLQSGKLQRDQKALEDRQNASILQAQLLADRNSENSWREGRIEGDDGAKAEDKKWLAYLDSRTDLDARHKVLERDKFLQTRQRAAVLGEFDRVKLRGLGAAESFIKDFRKPGRHPQLDADAVEGIAAEMERHTADLRQQRAMAVAELRDQADGAILRAVNGLPFDDLDKMAARARALGDENLARSISEKGGAARLSNSLAKLPLPVLQARVSEFEAAAKASTDNATAQRYLVAKEVLGKARTAMAADALTRLKAQGNDVPAIDWSKPETLVARAKAADHLSGVNGIHVPALTKGDADDLAARMEQASYEDRAKLLGNLHQGFGRRRFPEVLDAIKATAPEAAQAGALMAEGPEGQKAARNVLFGADLRRTVAKDGAAGGRQFMPPKDTLFKTQFQSALPPEAVAGLAPDDLAAVQQSIISAYAARSHAAGKASQDTLDAKLFDAAVADVIGGPVLKWNEKPLVPPVRGLTQDALDDVMDGLTAADLYGAQSIGGDPVQVADFKKYGTVRMHVPGRYHVFLNGQTVYRGGQPLVLDLAALVKGR